MEKKRKKDINARRKEKRHECSKQRKRDMNAGRKEKKYINAVKNEKET